MTCPGGTRFIMVCCSAELIVHPVLALLGNVLDWTGRRGLIVRYSPSGTITGVFRAFGVSSPVDDPEVPLAVELSLS